jgi:hypothetical protein
MGMSGQRHARPRFTPGKNSRYPMDRTLAGWTSELVWTYRLEEKSFASDGDWAQVVQSAVRHYINWATPAPTG